MDRVVEGGLGADGLGAGREERKERRRERKERKERKNTRSCAPCGLPAPAMMEMASPWLVWEMASTSPRSEDGAPRVARIGGCTCQGRGGVFGREGEFAGSGCGVVRRAEQSRQVADIPQTAGRTAICFSGV